MNRETNNEPYTEEEVKIEESEYKKSKTLQSLIIITNYIKPIISLVIVLLSFFVFDNNIDICLYANTSTLPYYNTSTLPDHNTSAYNANETMYNNTTRTSTECAIGLFKFNDDTRKIMLQVIAVLIFVSDFINIATTKMQDAKNKLLGQNNLKLIAQKDVICEQLQTFQSRAQSIAMSVQHIPDEEELQEYKMNSAKISEPSEINETEEENIISPSNKSTATVYIKPYTFKK